MAFAGNLNMQHPANLLGVLKKSVLKAIQQQYNIALTLFSVSHFKHYCFKWQLK